MMKETHNYRMGFTLAGAYSTYVDMGWSFEEMLKWNVLVPHTTGNLYFLKHYMPKEKLCLPNITATIIKLRPDNYDMRSKR
jgi:hypothetical protein